MKRLSHSASLSAAEYGTPKRELGHGFHNARRYLERWKLVEEQEITELRNTPIEVKAMQLGALMASRNLFREDPDRERGVREVLARWARLRKAPAPPGG